jgi:hypothetical protein
MKRTLTAVAAAIGSLLVPFGIMRAQTERAVYQVPFSFNAEGVELSSGKYILSSGTGTQTGMLRGPDGKGVLFIISGTLSGKDPHSRLTFNKYVTPNGDRYFLRQVWDGKTGSPMPVSIEEREILRNQQEAKTVPEKVTVAAKR